MHIFGWPSQPVMEHIVKNNHYIEDAAKRLQPDSLLLAFSDHGATRGGTHGGSTKEEIEGSLFAYSQKNLTFRRFLNPSLLNMQEQYLFRNLQENINMSFLIRDGFEQIDLIPTTASIFNAPIPFSSLGLIIPELMHYNNCSIAESIYELFMDHVINYLQILCYVKEFAEVNNKMKEHFVKINGKFNSIKSKINILIERGEKNNEIERNFIKKNLTNLNEEDLKKYKLLVKELFDIMQIIRNEIRSNSNVFKDQWLALNTIYLYSNLFFLILITLILALSIFIIFLELNSKIQSISSTILANGFTALFLIGLIILLGVFINCSDVILALIYAASILGLAICIRIIYKYKDLIIETCKSIKPMKSSIIFSIFIICIQAYGYTYSSYGIWHYGNALHYKI